MDFLISFSELVDLLNSSEAVNSLSAVLDTPFLAVDLRNDKNSITGGWDKPYRQPNCPVIALSDTDENVPAVVDLVADSEAQLELLTKAIRNDQMAATVLVQLLRHNERVSVKDGLFAESLAYSTLQNGESFIRWLGNRKTPGNNTEDPESPVLMERTGDQLKILLNRPHKSNAYSASLRESLNEALSLVELDSTIARVLISGAGANFSAGGDLDEFGLARDGAVAHVSRLTNSNGLLLDRLKDQTEFHLHGACIGAGIELPSFSSRVIAKKESFFQLPEVNMGLVPGAGGTVSILNRIGRVRTAFMAISNQRIDTKLALKWGLIDEIVR